MAAVGAGTWANRLQALLAAGVLIAFFLPWIQGRVTLTGLELVSLARGWQQEQAEAVLLVAYAAIPVTALLTLAATLLRHGVRLMGGLCGSLTVLAITLLWLARRGADPAQGVVAYGAYAAGAFGLLLLIFAFKLVRLPHGREWR